MEAIEYITEFLVKNGFEKCPLYFENSKCRITIHEGINLGESSTPGYYEIYIKDYDGEPASVYSRDLNIYWLVGTLTWDDLISKDYIK
jgi:hypothetical protein